MRLKCSDAVVLVEEIGEDFSREDVEGSDDEGECTLLPASWLRPMS